MATIAVIGTLDTKGAVHRFIKECIRRRGHRALLLDASLGGTPQIDPDITRQELLDQTGISETALDTDRETAAAIVGRCGGTLLSRLHLDGMVDGVIGVGGGCGARILAAAMSALPLGVPSVLISHLAPEALCSERRLKDVVMIRSLIKIREPNRVVRPLLEQAVGTVCGMIEFEARPDWRDDHQVIAVSRMGGADQGFHRASHPLREAGFQIVDFAHAQSRGGLMDSVIAGGLPVGVLDLCLADLADEVIGGVFGCGARRMEAAARRAIPTVVAPGGVDTVHFKQFAVPPQFWGRTLIEKDGTVLMRTNSEECRQIAAALAEKLNRFLGPITLCLPMRGLSLLGSPGQPFHDPSADLAFFETLQASLRDGVRVVRVHTTIEDAPFAQMCAQALLENIAQRDRDRGMLRRVEFFRDASERLLSEAVRGTEPRIFEAGELLHQQGAIVDGILFIVSGSAEIRSNGERVGKIGSGAIWGETAFTRRGASEEEVRALSRCEVLRLRRSGLNQLRRRHPDLDQKFQARSSAG